GLQSPACGSRPAEPRSASPRLGHEPCHCGHALSGALAPSPLVPRRCRGMLAPTLPMCRTLPATRRTAPRMSRIHQAPAKSVWSSVPTYRTTTQPKHRSDASGQEALQDVIVPHRFPVSHRLEYKIIWAVCFDNFVAPHRVAGFHVDG